MPLDLELLNPCGDCLRKGPTCPHTDLVNNVALFIASIHFYFISWVFNWRTGVLVFFAMMYFFAWHIFLSLRELNNDFEGQAAQEEGSQDEAEVESITDSELEEGEIKEESPRRTRLVEAIEAALEPSDSDSDEMPPLIPANEPWPRQRRNPNFLEEVD